jgi:hypothetical protein
LLLVAALASADSAPPAVQRGRPAAPCSERAGQQSRLLPRDGARRRADFVEFRRQLQQAVTQRNAAAVLTMVDPMVKLGFDGSGGADAFKERLNAPSGDVWRELEAIINGGGDFIQPDVFAAPYVYSNWPASLDSFECMAVTGAGVRLRERPGADGRTIEFLNHAVVQRMSDTSVPEGSGWQRVRLANGRTGYMSERYLRSPVDYRALFELKNGPVVADSLRGRRLTGARTTLHSIR